MKKLVSIFTPLAFLMLLVTTALAATPNPSPASPGYTPMVIPVMGVYSSNVTGIVKFKAPAGYRLAHASATARASSGTNPTLTVDLKQASTSLFGTPVAVTAGAIADAVLATTPKIPDEAAVSIDLATGGTSPKWRDITVFLLLKRL